MKYFVYVIGTLHKKKSYTYVGWTTNIEKRLKNHNTGKGARFTRGRFWKLLYQESLSSKRDAMAREWRLKRDRKFRNKILKLI